MKKTNYQRTCFYLEKKLIKKLKIYCLKKDISMSETIEILIKGLLNIEDEKK